VSDASVHPCPGPGIRTPRPARKLAHHPRCIDPAADDACLAAWDVYRTPETWARRAYRNLIYFHEVDRGGHFAAWEQPELFAAELRAAFRPLR